MRPLSDLKLNRRQKAILVVGVVLLAALAPTAVVVAETFLNDFYPATSGVHLKADNGPTVTTTKSYNLRSGNPFTPNSVNLSTESNGWLNLSSAGDTEVTVDEIDGTWTNVSALDVSSNELTIDASDKDEVRISGGADSFKHRQDPTVDDGTVDFIYSSTSGQTSVTLTNLTADGRIGVKDADTDDTLGTTVVDGSGGATFDSLPSGTVSVELVDAPDNVTIREESEPHDIVKNAQVEVLIAGSGETVDQRTITDGNVSLVGLPIDETYVVLVDSPNHHLRGVIVEDIFDQSSVFVLNETHTSVQNTFFVQDNTGRFTDPNIIIQKPINRSLYDSSVAAGYSWTTVGGDRLGADSRLVIDLNQSERYRIIIENSEGDRRILGEYTAVLNGTVTLTVGEITWENPTTGEGYQLEAYETNSTGQEDGIKDEIIIQYEDENNGTSEFCVVIHESGNISNTLQPEDCADDLGTYKATIPVSGDDLNTTWVANWSATVNGTEYGSTIPLSGIRELPIPIDPTWLGPGVLVLLIGGLAATPKASARTGGLLIVAFAFGLVWWGWVSIPLPALGLAGAVALLGKAADFNTRY